MIGIRSNVPDNITLLYLPPYSPELNPNYAIKSMDAVCAKLKQAILLHRTQSQARPLPYLLPLYRQLTLMRNWYVLQVVVASACRLL